MSKSSDSTVQLDVPDDELSSQGSTLERIGAKVRGQLFATARLTTRVGRFTVLNQVGKGGMGIVYAAYDEELDRKVAIKVLRRRQSPDPVDQARFQREAQAMARISHPNVATIHEVGFANGDLFLAMEFIRGQSLAKWAKGERSWREVVEVYVQAGEGLAAAHRAGVIHRDLKPQNIMIAKDGTVKVLDFGLARAIEDDTLESQDDEVRESGPGSILGEPFTHTGAMLGTPAYMAPEQVRRAAVDARTDQFSFCVAMYEALYGQRPYAAGNVNERMVSIFDGAIAPAPQGSTVPAEIRNVLVRGLAWNPANRWPSMDALLGALRARIVPARRRRLLSGVALGLLGLGIGGGMNLMTSPDERCTGARAELEGIWDDERKPRVRDAIVATELVYAPATWTRVERGLDDYAEGWVEAHTDACEATSVRHEQSEAQMEQRMRCLDRSKRRLRAAIDQLQTADATVVEHAVNVVSNLPDPTQCEALDELGLQPLPPADPTTAAKVSELEQVLIEARARAQSGRYPRALKLVEQALTVAERIGYEPLSASAHLQLGRLQRRTGALDDAVATLERAYVQAVASGMTSVAAEATNELVHVQGMELNHLEQGRRWVLHADALSQALGTADARADFMSEAAGVAMRHNELAEARALLEEALKLRRERHGAEHLSVVSTLDNLQSVASADGRFDEAAARGREVVAAYEALLGPRHPDVGDALIGLSLALWRKGDLEEAEAAARRAEEILEASLGREHSHVAMAVDMRGTVALARREYDDARRFYDQTRTIREAVLGPRDPMLASTIRNLGMVALRQGQLDEARAHFDRALAMFEATLGPEHLETAMTHNNLGLVYKSRGKLEDARAEYQRGLQVAEATLGPDHPTVAYGLINLATLASMEGNGDEALALYRRARTIREAAHGDEALEVLELDMAIAVVLTDLGRHRDAIATLERVLLHEAVLIERRSTSASPSAVRFALAKALWGGTPGSRDRARARSLAERAHDALTNVGGDAELQANIGAWLSEHRVDRAAHHRRSNRP